MCIFLLHHASTVFIVDISFFLQLCQVSCLLVVVLVLVLWVDQWVWPWVAREGPVVGVWCLGLDGLF